MPNRWHRRAVCSSSLLGLGNNAEVVSIEHPHPFEHVTGHPGIGSEPTAERRNQRDPMELDPVTWKELSNFLFVYAPAQNSKYGQICRWNRSNDIPRRNAEEFIRSDIRSSILRTPYAVNSGGHPWE